MPGKRAQGQSDEQTSKKASKMAHIVSVAVHTKHEVENCKKDNTAKNGLLLTGGNGKVAKFHSNQNGAYKAEDGAGGPEFRALVIVGNAQERATDPSEHIDGKRLQFTEETL